MSEALPLDQPWNPKLNWDSQPGALLLDLAAALSKERTWIVEVFGTAPLEMAYGNPFSSADADVTFPLDDYVAMRELIKTAALAEGDRPQYVQVVPVGGFRTSPKWKDRAHLVVRDSVTFRLAHPMDTLLGKLNRLEEKDFRAFVVMKEITGEPTEQSLIGELRDAADLFSMTFYSLSPRSFRQNVETLWPRFFGRGIDLPSEIFAPAVARLSESYETGRASRSALHDLAFDLGVDLPKKI